MSMRMRSTVKRLIFGLLQALVILIGVTFISFYLIHLSPKNPAEIWLVGTDGNVGQISEEALAALETAMGLDQPVPVQYVRWLAGIIRGDFGTSYTSGKTVTAEIANALGPTLLLSAVALALTLVISVPLGICCACKKNRLPDQITRIVSYFGISVPSFLAALLLMWLFCVKWRIFPVIAKNQLSGMVLPVIVLTFQCSAKFNRQVRTVVLGEMHKPYIQGAIARGCGRRQILFSHILKNCLVPILTWSGIYFGMMLGGLTVIESVFSWDGIGKLLVEAITYMDYYLIQGIVLVIAVLYLTINFLVDALNQCVDPRMRGHRP